MTETLHSPNAARLERTYDAPAELVWELWTTAAGLEEWFAPDGFESRVSELELRPGGQLLYTMTAIGPEQVAFMRETGNPLSVELRKTFTEVAPPTRLAYLSVIDFAPDHEPYAHLTTVDIEPAGNRTNLIMTIDPLHDETWTQGYVAHRGNELDNLEAAIRRRNPHHARVEQLAKEFDQLFERCDAAAMAAFFADDAEIMAPDVDLVRGRAAIEDFWTAASEAARDLGVKRTVMVRQTVVVGDLGYVLSTASLEMPVREGSTTRTFNHLTVWRADADGAWRIAADAASPAAAASA